MTDDALVLQQPRHVALAEGRDALDLEAVKRLAKVLALAEDGDPGQTGLEAFEADLLEEADIVDDGKAPLGVVVVGVEGVVAAPPAAGDTVGGMQPRFGRGTYS